jgi:hypothetical protein
MPNLIGKVLNYDEPTVEWVKGDVYEVISRGAFSPQALDVDASTYLNVNHQERITGAKIRLFDGRSGLYFSASLPDSAAVRSLMAASWQGVSISYDESTSKSWVDRRRTAWVRHTGVIGWVTGIAIVTGDGTPAFPGTWVAESSSESRARVVREEKEYLVRTLGRDYKNWPRCFWAPPPQAEWLEAELCNADPDREGMLRRGEIVL